MLQGTPQSLSPCPMWTHDGWVLRHFQPTHPKREPSFAQRKHKSKGWRLGSSLTR